MRLAIISTPRSGNTWLRRILSGLYGLKPYAAHRPQDLDWGALPENCIVQIHWHRTPEIAAFLGTYGFRALTLARHPLDVLISILHFSPFGPQTASWLAGEGGGETSILKRSPVSAEFLDYATGPRAKALLSVTPEWWNAENVARLRYEALVERPLETIETLFSSLGTPAADVQEVLNSLTLDKLRATANRQHFWKGCPGLWRSVLPPKTAFALAEAHSGVFLTLGYLCDPDRDLVDAMAEETWSGLQE